MPSALESVTALARNILKHFWIAVVLGLLIIVGSVLWHQRKSELIYVDNKPMLVELADTQHARELGLSYRSSLARGHGMLFDFNKPSNDCMWMKGMHFPIDVYWFSQTGKLISYVQNVRPESYPAIYCPNGASSYMLEVNIGELPKLPASLNMPKQ